MTLEDWPLVLRAGFGTALHAGREVETEGRKSLATRCGLVSRPGVLYLFPSSADEAALGASCSRCLRSRR